MGMGMGMGVDVDVDVDGGWCVTGVYMCVCRLIVGGFGLKVQASKASGLGEKKRRVTRWSGRKQYCSVVVS